MERAIVNMQDQEVLIRLENLEKEIFEIKRAIYIRADIPEQTSNEMHNAALEFLRLEGIPNKTELLAVEVIRRERKHGDD